MPRRTTRAVVLGVLALAVAVLATTAGAARSAAAQPVKIHVIAPIATPIQNYPDAAAGAQAAAAAINKAGGIKGRQIEIEVCNTQSNPNTAVACARAAVEDGAVAVVGHVDTFSPLTLPVLRQGGVPDVGIYSSGASNDWTDPIAFPLSGGAPGAYEAIPFALKKLGKKRVAMVYQDVPAAAQNAKLVRNAARAAKVSIVGAFQMAGSTTDFAPTVQKLREVTPDAVILVISPGISGGLIRASATFGLRPLWAHHSGSIGEAEAQQIGEPAEGMMIAAVFPPWRATSIPGVRRFNAEMDAIGKDDPLSKKGTAINSWLSVYAIAELGKRMKGALTSRSLLAALRAQKKPINLFGLYQFSPGKKGPAAFPRWSNVVYYFTMVKNGQLVPFSPKLDPINPLVAQRFVR